MSTSNSSPVHTVVVGCLIRNISNDVLLIRNHKRGWEIPQGRVEEGEDLVTALHREVLEEAGVEVEVGSLAAVWSMISLPPAVIFTFLGRYRSGVLSGSGDSAEACWFTEREALGKVTGTVMNERLKALLHYNGSTIYRSYTTRPYQLQKEMEIGQRPEIADA
jgi:8-oxo-dGTP diphosphatase